MISINCLQVYWLIFFYLVYNLSFNPLVSFSLQFLHFSAPEFLFGFFLCFLCLYQSFCFVHTIFLTFSTIFPFPFLSIPKAVASNFIHYVWHWSFSGTVSVDFFLLICHTFLFVCPVILLLKTGHKNLMYLNPRIILSHFPRVYFLGEGGEEVGRRGRMKLVCVFVLFLIDILCLYAMEKSEV